MASAQLKDQILKVIFRKIGQGTTSNAPITGVMISFDNVDKDTFFDAVEELIAEQLLFDRSRGYVALTPDGWDKANLLVNPPPVVNQNSLSIGQAHNSPIQQGIHSTQEQNTTYAMPSNEDLGKLVDLMRAHLADLSLSPSDERKANAQLATIEAQLLDEPNPVVIREAGRTLKNITEGAIGSLLATAAQPHVWSAIKALLALL